jgi:hypothetical protein
MAFSTFVTKSKKSLNLHRGLIAVLLGMFVMILTGIAMIVVSFLSHGGLG